MDDEIERAAEAIHSVNPVTFEGNALDWAAVVRKHPERAAMYREAARNRVRGAASMERLGNERQRPKPLQSTD